MSKSLFLKVVLLGALLSAAAGATYQWVAARRPAETYTVYLPMVAKPPLQHAWLGPYGGSPVVLAFDPAYPDIVYAGSWGAGVFKSLDGGYNWQASSTGLGALYINSLAIDPQQHHVLYAGTYKGGIYKSIDAGQTWFAINNGFNPVAVVYTIAVDPTNSNLVYAGARDGSVDPLTPPFYGELYKSYDGGANWVLKLNTLGGADQQDWVYSLAISPLSPSYILAAAHQQGCFRSLDYGETWQACNIGVSDLSGRAMVIHPTTWGTAYYGVWHLTGTFKTLDYGVSWSKVNSGTSGSKIYSMTIDPTRPATVYAATYNLWGLLRTTNGGTKWASAGLQGIKLYSVAVSPASGQIVLSGSAGEGLYHTADGGVNWYLTQTGFDNSNITGMVALPEAPQTLYSSVFGAGVQRSYNGGIAWGSYNPGLGSRTLYGLVMNPVNHNILYALTDSAGIYWSDVAASSGWQPLNSGLPMTRAAAAPFGPEHPFADRETLLDPASLAQAAAPDAPLATAAVLKMVFAKSVPTDVYIGTATYGVYVSHNSGGSWTYAGLGGSSVSGLAINPLDPKIVYATNNVSGTIQMTTNAGSTWTPIYLAGRTAYALDIPATNPAVLYVGTSNGAYRWSDNAWTAIGLAGQSITAIATHPTQAEVIYAGALSGLYFTLDGGVNWQAGPAELDKATIQAISFDPTNPDIVYISTKTHGIMRVVIPTATGAPK